MHFLIYGTGAVGGMIGARLAFSGQRVTFLARGEAADRLRADGLTLVQGGTSRRSHVHTVTDLPGQASEDRPDVIFLTVKGYDCLAAAQAIRGAWADPPPVVCWLNGVGHEATLSAWLGQDRVIPATLTTAVRSTEPGVVRVERERGIGLARGHALVPALGDAFVRAGMETKYYAFADAMKWSKLLTNIVGNATSAILDWTVDEVFRHPGLARVEIEALREATRVMRTLGLRPVNLPGVPVGLLARLVFLPPPLLQPILGRVVASGRGKKRPSFHADIGRGRSEVDWINGAVVQHAEKLGLGAPANSVLTGTLLQLVHTKGPIPSDLRQPRHLLASAAAQHVPGISGV